MLLVSLGLYSASYKAFMALSLKFVALILFVGSAVLHVGLPGAQIGSHQTHLQQNNASYVDEPLDQLLQTIPEIKTLQPAQDQTQLAMILEHSGKNVDMEFRNSSDLAAKEVVSEIRDNPTTDLWGQPTIHSNEPNLLEDQYTYFIVREGTLVQTRIREYRRDRYGSDGAKPITSPSLATVPGMTFLSANFASSLLYFSSDLQGEERFRYLGEQHVGVRTAYVVAFAQVPGVATVSIPMRMTNGEKSNWLVQGIAWIDKSTFEILQMRTDLLARHDLLPTCGHSQDQLQTLIQFAPVQPYGASDVMWLPTEADVHETQGDCKNRAQIARNVHRFTDYQRYRGSEGRRSSEMIEQKNQEAHPYLEQPLKELVKRIPELKGIRPSADQQQLSSVLQKTGGKVDELLSNLVDLIAREEITQERLIYHDLRSGMPGGSFPVTERVRDSYLILRRKESSGARINEFRMDAAGNRIAEESIDKGFFVTSGFALSSVHFSTASQWDSRFLLLGDQKIDGQDTYVVAFAQIPGEAHNTITMVGRHGFTAHLLTQGIAWVDKRNFHILRMRTDLLARQPEIGLELQTTKIRFFEVRFADVPVPLWLPREVDVDLKFADPAVKQDAVNSQEPVAFGAFDTVFRNVHRYTDYRRYRVSTKMLTP
jgi:hypothetical protein